MELQVSAASFFQVHRQGAETLVELAGRALQPAAWVQPVDLFPQTAHVQALTALYPATSG